MHVDERIRVSEIAVAIVAAAAGALVGFLVTPGNRVAPFPWHHDDFNNLGWAGAWIGFGVVRPVSFAIWSVLGRFGPGALYAGLFALVAVFLGLSVLWVASVLQVQRSRRVLAAVSFATAASFFLFEWSSWTLRYTGHTTNAASAAFGMGAALLALRCQRSSGASLATMLALYAVSAFAKEDFLLIPMVSATLGGLDGHATGDRRGRARALAVLAAFAGIAATAVVYNLVSKSPFLFGSGTYEAKLDPADLADTAAWYLFCTRYARNVIVGLALTTLASVALGLARPIRWLMLWLGIAALIAPYLPLAAHRYALYASDWLPIMLAAMGWSIAMAALESDSRRARALALSCGLLGVISLYGIARKERDDYAASISQAQRWSREAVERAAALLRSRSTARVVAVSGTDQYPHGPWFASDGAYLNRTVGREVRWIVLQRADSFARRVIRDNAWPLDWGRIVDVDESCRSTLLANGIPILEVGAEAQTSAEPDRPPRPAPEMGECGVHAARGSPGPGS